MCYFLLLRNNLGIKIKTLIVKIILVQFFHKSMAIVNIQLP